MATIDIDLRWDDTTKTDGESATWGDLRIFCGTRQIWGAVDGASAAGIRWTWIELLEHISDCWPWLVGDQGWPSPLPSHMSPSEFDDACARELEVAGSWRRRIEASIFEFRERHDLAFALKGKKVPRLWVVRQGQEAWLGNLPVAVPWSQVLSLLLRIGGEIATRLRPFTDERATCAVKSWEQREQASSLVRAEAVTGLSEAQLNELAEGVDPAVALELPSSGFESSELSFVARLAGPTLRAETGRRLLTCIRQSPLKRSSAILSELVGRLGRVDLRSGYAFDQGWQLARWLRAELNLASAVRADPQALLADWGVALDSVDLRDPWIDAVACWGPAHGPAIYVNESGQRAQGENGRRATIAHEVAHLLLDRSRALPLSEIQGRLHRGRVESRANAFAAEFLMPQHVAGEAFVCCIQERESDVIVEQLSRHFGVSREIIAWQALRNTSSDLSSDVRGWLSKYVPEDRRYQFAHWA